MHSLTSRGVIFPARKSYLQHIRRIMCKKLNYTAHTKHTHIQQLLRVNYKTRNEYYKQRQRGAR
jgi:hypothetical protein